MSRARRRSVHAGLLASASLLAACGSSTTTPSTRPVATYRAEPSDPVALARLEADATARTFLGLWPRELGDGAPTVRDGDPVTGWKAPARATSRLEVDLHLLGAALPLASVRALWERPPRGPVELRASTSCARRDGTALPWPDPTRPLAIDARVGVGCLELFVSTGAQGASLAELSAEPGPSGAPPGLGEPRLGALEGGLELTWATDRATPDLVEVHFLEPGRASTGPDSLVDRVAGVAGRWEGPRPLEPGSSVALLARAADGTAGPALALAAPPRDVPTLAGSGVVEGFFGQPWSHRERRRMLLRLARAGLGLYVYAPKDDPLHRARWREPYPPDAMARFAELRALGERLGVTVVFGIGPPLGEEAASDATLDALATKLAPFVEMGFRDFALLVDDIETVIDLDVNATLGAAHASLAGALLRELERRAGEPAALWLVPTVYSAERQRDFADGPGYLEALAGLDPAIRIIWTGPGTSDRELSGADFAEVARRIGRRPVHWENWWANDGGDGFVGRVYLAPYLGRDASLADAVAGVLVNPMFLGALDRIVVPQVADFLRDPTGFDPRDALARAVALEARSGPDAELLAWMVASFDGAAQLGAPGINLPVHPALEAALEGFETRLADGEPGQILAAGAELGRVAADMATARARLRNSSLDADLVDDLWFPAGRHVYEGQALLDLLEWTGSRLAGSPDESALTRADAALAEALRQRYQVSLLRVNAFRVALERTPVEPGSFRRIELAPPPERLDVGREARWTPSPGREARIHVAGLPGARVTPAGTIEWRPPHPGRYEAAVFAADASGWGLDRRVIDVAP